MKVDQTLNIQSVYNFYQNAKNKDLRTVICVKANVIYTDTKSNKELYHSSTTLHIDTVDDDQITIENLPDSCFSQFSTKFQQMSYANGVLSIKGDGFGTKSPYMISVMG
jgi:hypothetical protein